MKSGLDAKPLFLQVDMLSQQLVPNDWNRDDQFAKKDPSKNTPVFLKRFMPWCAPPMKELHNNKQDDDVASKDQRKNFGGFKPFFLHFVLLTCQIRNLMGFLNKIELLVTMFAAYERGAQ